MSDHFNLNEGIKEAKSKIPKFKKFSFKFNKKLLFIILVGTIGIPLTVILSQQEQEIRKQAAGLPSVSVFKKAIRFSSEFIYPTNQPTLKGKPSANVTQRSEMWTVEGFIRVSPFSGSSQTGGTQPLISALKEKTAKDKGYVFLLSLDVANTGTSKPKLSLLTGSTNNPEANYTTIGERSTITLTPDRWYHIAGEFGYIYDTKECYVALWIDGQLAEVLDKGINKCPFNLPDIEKIQLGGNLPFPVPTVAPLPNITLDIDEVSVTRGVLKYYVYYIQGKSFSRPTEPFTKNPYTAFLWHFDDNFKDEGYYGYDLDFLEEYVQFIDSDIPAPPPSPTPTPTPTPTPPITQKLTLNPSADAFVRSSASTTNFGASTNLEVDSAPNEITYLKFNLGNLAGKTIVSAKLRIKVSDATAQTLNLRRGVNLNWTEGGITFNNRPGFEAVIRSFTANSLNQVIELDVKNVVNLRKGGKVTFGINSTGNDAGAIYSRESASSNRPQLIVEYR